MQYAEGDTTRCLVYYVQRCVLIMKMAWILAILYSSKIFVAATLATKNGRIILIIIIVLCDCGPIAPLTLYFLQETINDTTPFLLASFYPYGLCPSVEGL